MTRGESKDRSPDRCLRACNTRTLLLELVQAASKLFDV
jgi:hypothetical protein